MQYSYTTKFWAIESFHHNYDTKKTVVLQWIARKALLYVKIVIIFVDIFYPFICVWDIAHFVPVFLC